MKPGGRDRSLLPLGQGPLRLAIIPAVDAQDAVSLHLEAEGGVRGLEVEGQFRGGNQLVALPARRLAEQAPLGEGDDALESLVLVSTGKAAQLGGRKGGVPAARARTRRER